MTGLTVECAVHFRNGRHGRKRMRTGREPRPGPVDTGRVPRLSRLMALAIRFDRLVREGHVRDYADLARLGHVTRARLTQIMSLRLLAPDIQEEILFLPRVSGERSGVCERHVRGIAAMPDWRKQRQAWRELLRRAGQNAEQGPDTTSPSES